MEFASDLNQDFNVDGEFAFRSKTADIEVIKQAIEIIVPEKAFKQLFDNEHYVDSKNEKEEI